MDNFYYSLASGSSGNCGLLALDGTYILIDLGVSVRRLTGLLAGLGLTIDDLDAVLLTHEHIDHIKVWQRSSSVTAFHFTPQLERLRYFCKFPQANDHLRPFYSGANFTVGNVKVYAFRPA
ncbi:MAG: MBL fold metallo-hydrolase [Butyricicoccus pullicaecorum]